MQSFPVPWSFFMIFEYDKNRLNIHSSDDLRLKHPQLDQQFILEGESIKDMIHRYDYRKLIFFSQNPLIQPFDTLLRVKFIEELGYMKTQAICKSHAKGFHCILIEDKYYHKLKTLWKLEDTKHTMITFLDESLESYEKISEINEFKSHLTKMFTKVLI